MAAILSSLGVAGPALVVTGAPDQQVVRAAHNLERVWTTPVNLLNAHDLLRFGTVVMTVDAARRAEEMWAVEPHGRRGKSAEGTPVRLRVLQRRIKKDAPPGAGAPESSESAIATGEAPTPEAPARQRAPRRPPAEPAESGPGGSGVAE